MISRTPWRGSEQKGVPALSWLATGLYISPVLCGHEPKLRKLGVGALFWALICMVFLAAGCIGLFYATSLTWAPRTHYSMVEY